MHSSLFKHIWLIQPSPPVPSVIPIDAANGTSVHFSPSWDLLCLQSFLLERTGHTCTLIDTRCHESTEAALQILRDPPDARTTSVAVIYTTIDNLGSAISIAAHVRKQFPSMITALCGPYVASFPETIELFPGVQFGLAGDPEIILRNLLEFIDIEHRLKLVPGLIIPGVAAKNPHWVRDLHSLSLPEWFRVDWRSYSINHHHKGVHLEARISRGHPGKKEDRAWPVPQEPLRLWPLPLLAQLLQKCSGHGITEVFFADPPGLWTDDMIMEWCRHLRVVRNSQAWSFQLVPRMLTNELITELAANGCRRIEFIIPTCDTGLRSSRGLELTDRQIATVLSRVKAGNILPLLAYWIQGPGEPPGEAARVLQHISAMDYPPFALCPHPFFHDSMLFREEGETQRAPPISAWLEWAQKPDENKPPPALWRGTQGVAECQRIMNVILKNIHRNPWHQIRRAFRFFRGVHGRTTHLTSSAQS